MTILSSLLTAPPIKVAAAGSATTVKGPGVYDITTSTASCAVTVSGNQPLTLVVRQGVAGGVLAFSANVQVVSGFGALSSAVGKYDVIDLVPGADGTFTATYRVQGVIEAGSGSGGSTGGGGSSGSGGSGSSSPLITPDTSFDGYGRKAREVLNSIGVCGSLTDATAAQYAAALEGTHINLLRLNSVSNGASSLSAMQAVRSAQASLGSVRPVRYLGLAMGYLNDLTPWSTQAPLLLAQVQAGIMWGIEGPNEINNSSTGGGSRGPNDSTNKTAAGAYELNLIDWANQLLAFKAANQAVFAQYGTVILSSSLAPVSGTSTDYDTGNMDIESLTDYAALHFYAGNGFQPSLPFGPDPNTGYFSNIAGWAKTGFSPTGVRQLVLTESGATTEGSPGYARDGVSQAKYILNQQMEALALNIRAVFTYQLFDGSGNAGDIEGCFGIYNVDKATPKPAALALARMQNIRALNNNANDAANVAEMGSTSAFAPGINMAQVAVVGVTSLPNGMRPYLAEYKSDGSTVLWIWNEPVIDSNGNVGQGGTDVTPAADAVTVYLPRARSWRLHDPMGTDSLTSGAWTTSDTVTLTLAGYPMAIEVAAPSGWTASGGDPADVPLTGSTYFQLGQVNSNYAHNYGGTAPDDLFVQVGPPSGKTFTPGNFAILVACTPASNTPACAGATILGTYSVSGVTGAKFTVFKAPILNPHAVFSVTGTGSASSCLVFEVPAFDSYTAFCSLCAWTGGNYGTGNTVTAQIEAIPTGDIGLFAIGVPTESGGESYANPTDTTVQIDLPIIVNTQAYQAQAWGGTVAAGRAAGSVTFGATNINYATGSSPIALSMAFGSTTKPQPPAAAAYYSLSTGSDGKGDAVTTVVPPATFSTSRSVRVKIRSTGFGGTDVFNLITRTDSAGQFDNFAIQPTNMIMYYATSGTGNGYSAFAATSPLPCWVRFDQTPSGAITTYSSPDGSTWTQLATNSGQGAPVALAGVPFTIGTQGDGKVLIDRAVIIYDGATILDVDFTTATAAGQATVTATTGGTVTIIGDGAIVTS